MKKFFTALLIMVLTSPLFANPDPAVTLQTTALTNPFPSTFVVNVAFTEPVTGFVPGVVNVTNGTVVSITGTPCQFIYTMVIQPNDAGAVNVFIPANVVVSLTTGSPNLASNLLSLPGVGPSPTVVLQTSTLTNPFPSTFVVNVAFNEPVGGLVAADVNVTNGTLVSITGNACQMEYALVIQPNSTGPISVFIPANAVVSLTTGAPNLASNLLNIPGASPNPTVGLQTSTLSNPFPLSFPVNVTFSEAVTGFAATDVNVTNGTVVSVTGSNLQNFVVVIQPNATGAVNAVIPANSVVSQATGAPNLASNLLSIPGLNANLPPASNFNLNPWSLTLPLPLGSQNNAISIGKATLNGTPGANNGYTNPPYFFTDPVTGAMNFFAPLNGATTPGGQFARTELYEILPGASGYWKLSTFASNELTASLLVSQLPPARKRLVIGEIHDKGNIDSFGNSASDSPLLHLYYDMNSRDPNGDLCNGCVYAQVRITPAQSSFLKRVTLAQRIPLNTIFTYKLRLLRDGTLTITANNVSTVIKLNTSTNRGGSRKPQKFPNHFSGLPHPL